MQVIKKIIASNEYEIAKNILYTILNRLKCSFGSPFSQSTILAFSF